MELNQFFWPKKHELLAKKSSSFYLLTSMDNCHENNKQYDTNTLHKVTQAQPKIAWLAQAIINQGSGVSEPIIQ